jgi:NADH-quinone oxidoreductase subunit G
MRVDLGPHIVLDAERCILCTRCIRVCDEVAGEHQLEISNRGDHSELGTAPGQELNNPYSLNTVDVCPVGALTSKDFRFSMRAWELMSTPSICTGCSTGCNIEIHHRGGKTYRLIPRENTEVNDFWMCDEGRFTYHSLSEKRLVGPLIEGMPSKWNKALNRAAELLRDALEDEASVGVVFSPHRSNEDNYLLAKLVEVLKIKRIYIGGLAPDPQRADEVLRKADRSPNRQGAHQILSEVEVGGLALLEDDLLGDELKTLLVLGHEHSLSEEAMEKAASMDCLIAISDHEEGLAARAHVALPAAAWAENTGSMSNFEGRVQRMQAAYPPKGQARQVWQICCDLANTISDTTSMNYESAEAVFNEMKKNVAAFGDAKWGKDLLPIQLRFANSRG